MRHFADKIRIFKTVVFTLAVAIILSLFVVPGMVSAKRGESEDRNRSVFHGIVQFRPDNGLHGKWVIGDRTFIADTGTEFDQSEGQLAVGACAKVDVRNDRVHEIDSEPMRDCQ